MWVKRNKVVIIQNLLLQLQTRGLKGATVRLPHLKSASLTLSASHSTFSNVRGTTCVALLPVARVLAARRARCAAPRSTAFEMTPAQADEAEGSKPLCVTTTGLSRREREEVRAAVEAAGGR